MQDNELKDKEQKEPVEIGKIMKKEDGSFFFVNLKQDEQTTINDGEITIEDGKQILMD